MTNETNDSTPAKRRFKSDPRWHEHIMRKVAERPPLSDEQREYIEAILQEGARLKAIASRPPQPQGRQKADPNEQ